MSEACFSCFRQSVMIFVTNDTVANHLLIAACVKKNLNPVEHFLRIKEHEDTPDEEFYVPPRQEVIDTYVSGTAHQRVAMLFEEW